MDRVLWTSAVLAHCFAIAPTFSAVSDLSVLPIVALVGHSRWLKRFEDH